MALTPDRSVAHSTRTARVQGLGAVTCGFDEDEVKKPMFPMFKELSCAKVCVVS